MSLVINHNLMAMNAARDLNDAYQSLGVSSRRLSSGLRGGEDGQAQAAAQQAQPVPDSTDQSTAAQAAANQGTASQGTTAQGFSTQLREKLETLQAEQGKGSLLNTSDSSVLKALSFDTTSIPKVQSMNNSPEFQNFQAEAGMADSLAHMQNRARLLSETTGMKLNSIAKQTDMVMQLFKASG